MQLLTLARLKQLVSYDPETGMFTRLTTRGGYSCGTLAGTVRPTGYIYIALDGRAYAAHRLAWLYVYGLWPVRFIDHRDLDRSNNRIANLREANDCQNRWNTSLNKNNKSGLRGVCFEKDSNLWVAQIGRRRLGRFKSRESAYAAYCQAAAETYGEFAPRIQPVST